MPARYPLQTLQVQSPCPADWNTMTGDQQRRFCEHCQKHVHDLSTMPAEEAERLICSAAGELCVRYARDPQTNQVITLDYRPPPPTSPRRAMLVVASLLAACGVSASWAAVRILRKPPAPPVNYVVGRMLPPRLPPTTGPTNTCPE
jgi:hypothetical protein